MSTQTFKGEFKLNIPAYEQRIIAVKIDRNAINRAHDLIEQGKYRNLSDFIRVAILNSTKLNIPMGMSLSQKIYDKGKQVTFIVSIETADEVKRLVKIKKYKTASDFYRLAIERELRSSILIQNGF